MIRHAVGAAMAVVVLTGCGQAVTGTATWPGARLERGEPRVGRVKKGGHVVVELRGEDRGQLGRHLLEHRAAQSRV